MRVKGCRNGGKGVGGVEDKRRKLVDGDVRWLTDVGKTGGNLEGVLSVSLCIRAPWFLCFNKRERKQKEKGVQDRVNG